MRQESGGIWKWDGITPCDSTSCPGWKQLDRNPETKEISVGHSVIVFEQTFALLQKHANGKIWKWDNKTPCNSNVCLGWLLLDRNTRTKDIVSHDSSLYQLHVDGKIWEWDNKTPCNANSCPGWTLIDRNRHTKAIVPYKNYSPPHTGPK